MRRQRRNRRYEIPIALAAAVGVAGVAPGLLGSGATPALAEATSPAGVTAPTGLSAEAARMYVAVRRPRPGELGWQQIPWGVNLQEAARVARKENRPLLMFVSGDDPLEKC